MDSKLIFIGGYYKLSNNNVFSLYKSFDINHISFLKRNSAKKFIHLLSREVIKSIDNTNTNTKYIVMEHNHKIHNYLINIIVSKDDRFWISISTKNYRGNIKNLLNELSTEYERLVEFRQVSKYQINDCTYTIDALEYIVNIYKSNPKNKIEEVSKQVDEVKTVMKLSIDKLLERGDKIQTCFEKTSILDVQALEFQKTSKKYKKCCNIM